MMTLSHQVFEWLRRRSEAAHPGVKVTDIAVLIGADKDVTILACKELEQAGMIRIVKYRGSRQRYAALPLEPDNANQLNDSDEKRVAGVGHETI